MLRRLFPLFALLVLAICFLLGCGSSMNTRQKVREDLLAHLRKAGFDTNAMDIDIAQVSFDGNKAHAAVSFRPKGATSVHDGMTMNYTLESRDGHWSVVGRADSQGHGSQMGGGANLPPGHPPMGSMPSGESGQPLPPGHPQISPNGGGQPGGTSQPPTGGQSLPPGHPKVSFLGLSGFFTGETETPAGTGLSV